MKLAVRYLGAGRDEVVGHLLERDNGTVYFEGTGTTVVEGGLPPVIGVPWRYSWIAPSRVGRGCTAA